MAKSIYPVKDEIAFVKILHLIRTNFAFNNIGICLKLVVLDFSYSSVLDILLN